MGTAADCLGAEGISGRISQYDQWHSIAKTTSSCASFEDYFGVFSQQESIVQCKTQDRARFFQLLIETAHLVGSCPLCHNLAAGCVLAVY